MSPTDPYRWNQIHARDICAYYYTARLNIQTGAGEPWGVWPEAIGAAHAAIRDILIIQESGRDPGVMRFLTCCRHLFIMENQP